MSEKIKRAEKNVSAIKPVKAFSCWSYVPEFWSDAIVNITGKQLPDKSDGFSHQFKAFEMSNGKTEAYEALFSKGFIGPEPLEDIVRKVKGKSGRIVIEELPITGQELQEMFDRCRSWVGKKGYYKWQLAAMWFFERFGRWLGVHIRRTPGIVVCSEVVARLVAGLKAMIPSEAEGKVITPYIDLRDEIRTRFDEVNPNSSWRKWLRIKGENQKEQIA